MSRRAAKRPAAALPGLLACLAALALAAPAAAQDPSPPSHCTVTGGPGTTNMIASVTSTATTITVNSTTGHNGVSSTLYWCAAGGSATTSVSWPFEPDPTILNTITVTGLDANTDHWVLRDAGYAGKSGWHYIKTKQAGGTGPTITIAGGAAVTEGTAAAFTLTASPAPSSDLTVSLTVSEADGSDFVAAGDEGSKTVTISSGSTTASYSVTTQADSTDEPNGSVTVTVGTGTGYTVGTTSSASVTVNDDDDPPVTTPTITIAGGAAVTEGTAAAFTLTANPAPSADLTVSLTVSEAAGSDFVAAGNEGAKTVTISSGDTTASYSVATEADSADEPDGSVTVTVGAGTGYSVGAASSASVTVNDDDPADTTAPSLSTAEVDGDRLTLTYDEALDMNSTPATTQFTVVIAAGTGLAPATAIQRPTNVDVSGMAVTLTLGTPPMSGQTVTVSYTAGTDPIRDTAVTPNNAANLSNRSVDNNTALVSSFDTENRRSTSQFNLDYAQAFTTGSRATSLSRVELELGRITGRTPPAYAVRIHADDGTGRPGASLGTLTNPSVASIPEQRLEPVRFTAPTGASDKITLAGGTTYWVVVDNPTAPASQAFGTLLNVTAADAELAGATTGWSVADAHFQRGPTQTTWGTGGPNQTTSLAMAVHGAAVAPTLSKAVVNGATLVLTFNAPLDTNSRPPAAAFTVNVAGTNQTPTNVSMSGATVTLTLGTAVTSGQTVTVSYNKTAAGSTPLRDSSSTPLEVAGFTGQAVTNNTLAPPVFTSQPTTASVNENSPGGTAVATVAADAVTGVTLDYSLDATSAAVFDIDSSSGAITVKSGAALDHEATASYTAVVTADNGSSTSTHTVTISVTDVDEPPDAPRAPTVNAVDGSTTSLSVSWTAPDVSGKPAITDYDVQYQEAGAAGWTDAGFDGTDTMTTITSLNASTGYNVQVRATNAEGASGWSASGSGTTNSPTNNAPTFPPTTPTTASVPENSAGGTAVVTIAASDSDAGDTLGYTLDATSAAVFDISSSGAITVKSGATLDHEARSSYTTAVTASDGTASAEHTVTISVSDVDEPPPAPPAPAVNAVAGSTTSLRASWTAPAASGRPPVTDYDVQYRESGSWTAWPFSGPARATTITGLDPGTTYEVQVRARNAEGVSDWSPSASGTTGAPVPPAFQGATVSGNTVTIRFAQGLDPTSVPPPEAFAVTVDGNPVQVTDVRLGSVILTLAESVSEGQQVTVAYDKTLTGSFPLRGLDGVEVDSFDPRPVRRDTGDGGQDDTEPSPPDPQPLQLALWTDRPGYRTGDTVRLHYSLDPHDDRGRYRVFAYLERAGGGRRRYLAPLSAAGELYREAVDARGLPERVADARSLAPADRELAFEGPAPGPGLWQFVLELRPGSPDGQREQPAEDPRTRRAWAKFAVAERSRLLNVRGFDREVREDLTLRSDTLYYLQHQLFVHAGATLAIEPGTVVQAWGRQAAIIVLPGGKLVAEGTRQAPVVLTCSEPAGQRRPGCWGGLRILGRAPVTRLEGTAPGVLPAARAAYGGSEPEGSSGALRYVRVEFAGASPDPEAPAPAVGLYGAGSGTVLDHVQARASLGDGFAFHGGAASCDYCVASGSGRAGLAWQRGWRGEASHLYVQHGRGGRDGLAGGHDPQGHDLEPRSRPTLSNVTLVHAAPYGRHERRAAAVRLSDGGAVRVRDLLAARFGDGALRASGRSSLLFGEGASSIRGAVLWNNGSPQVPGSFADSVEYSVLKPQLRDVRDFANPDPRPKPAANLVMYTLKVDAHQRAGYIGAFHWERNWLEEWTVFGPESVYDLRQRAEGDN